MAGKMPRDFRCSKCGSECTIATLNTTSTEGLLIHISVPICKSVRCLILQGAEVQEAIGGKTSVAKQVSSNKV